MAETTTDPALAVQMRGVCKSFGTNEVLRGVDFDLKRGEVHALLGGNGAGKSTLMKILQGVHRPDAGHISIDGSPVEINSPADATKAGIGMVFQEFSLIPSLSVAANIFLGREPRRFGLVDDHEINRRARTLLGRMGAHLDPRRTVADLPVGYWQVTEIAKALSSEASILVMDEPTASLPYSEVDTLFELIGRLKQQGISIIYISHRMAEIARVADRLTVLRDGRRVLTDQVAAVSSDRIAETIVGREILYGFHRTAYADSTAATVLSLDGMTTDQLTDISFTVAEGEVVGLAGLIGSGRTELARCLFGIDPRRSGTVRVRGRAIPAHRPQDAIDAGIMLVPEDRKCEGLVGEHSVRTNMLLPSLSHLGRRPFLDDRRGRQVCHGIAQRLNIRASALNEPVLRLSGGNQQKVVFSKWLALAEVGIMPEVLILDEPTAGVDIASKVDIMQLVLDLADSGTAIVLISSELEELLAVTDRVLVMRHGRIETTLDRADIANEESLQLAIQGV
ncbi:sugar ABC transporter ATP-binding protein [Mycobacterium aquaticum]|uniref:Sugar ABC transporter ATP-binding protein n=1 Tax=Mycobacterium aquaticum TaxID=1927124 RepID=A0A1X0AXZ7_9MYCO|nr:sugar ABC transporter ATP-binding protein [Mycobacterium aquaticum]ORA34913.1 sugar ABC transporter ATP-binding protein [Mycobacterium aquaticum]